MEWTQLSKSRLEFLKIHTDIFRSVIEFCKTNQVDDVLSSKLELNFQASDQMWNDLKKIEIESENKQEVQHPNNGWMSETPKNEITDSNIKFLVDHTKNWNQLKTRLFRNLLLPNQSRVTELLGCPDEPASAYKYNLIKINSVYTRVKDHFEKFLDALKRSGNGLIAQLLRKAKHEFLMSVSNGDIEIGWKENEEDLSKYMYFSADPKLHLWSHNESLTDTMPNFINYVRLPYFCEIGTLRAKLMSVSLILSDAAADFQVNDKTGECELKLKQPGYKPLVGDGISTTNLETISGGGNNEYLGENVCQLELIHSRASVVNQCGTSNRPEIFSPNIGPGPVGHPNILTWMHLEHLDIYTPFLFQTLENCPNLRILRVLDVRFIGELNRRVALPKLQTFALATKLANFGKGEGRSVDKSLLKSVIFFDREKGQAPWVIDRIHELKIDIDVCLNGERVLKIRHEDGLLFSQLGYTNDILKKIWAGEPEEFQLKKLFIRFCEIDVGLLPQDLVLLEVKDVTFPRAGDLDAVLNHCTELETLRVGYTQSTVFNLFHLAKASRLKCLYLYNVHIPYLPVVVKLETLLMHCCSLAQESVDKFSRIFKATRILIICKTMEHCNFCSFCSHICMLNEARKSECASWISMKKFDRGHRNNHTDRRDYLVEQEVESFLKKAGVSKGSTHFVLEKEDADCWSGKDVVVDDEGWAEQQHLIQKFEVLEDDMTVPMF